MIPSDLEKFEIKHTLAKIGHITIVISNARFFIHFTIHSCFGNNQNRII